MAESDAAEGAPRLETAHHEKHGDSEGADGLKQIEFALDADADCSANEIEEFYSYVEAPLLDENRASWHDWCEQKWDLLHPQLEVGGDAPRGAWIRLSGRARRQVLQRLLHSLDLQDPVARLVAARSLLYHLQGSFSEIKDTAEQLAWIRSNARMIFELGGLDDVMVACKRACWKHDWLSTLPDYLPHENADQPLLTPKDKAEYLEEVNMEVTVYFAQLYALLEALRGEAILSEELMAHDPPVPIYLFQLVANLREKSIKGFPVKKLILLLWKSLLATFGRHADLVRCKKLRRELEGLSGSEHASERTPVAPTDIHLFRNELVAKYPTLNAGFAQELDFGNKLSSAMQPLPQMHKAEMRLETPVPDESERPKSSAPFKGGRQKYQTDQNRPYVLPYSQQTDRDSVVPFSIQEALALYHDHLYVDTDTWQLYVARQQMLGEMQGRHEAHPEALVGNTSLSAKRLAWVDQVYRGVYPFLQSAVIVLLKLLLATTTSGGTNSAYARAVAEGTPSEHAPDPTLEDMDIVRHREILNKGISSLLLLCLQWFRASHVLKFEYLAQVMLDSNVLLLILKMLGLQEVSHFVRWRCEEPSFGLFGYCRRMNLEENVTPQGILASCSLRIGDVWDEFPDDEWRTTHAHDQSSAFSWRNFATVANLTRILHKVCKNKVHRILLLMQYKSSAILKRMLQVPHRGLELYVLKLIRSQVPFCGRKWRQSNMRIITLIYLRCRSGLRDDWLGSGDMDASIESSLSEEQTLRALIHFYNQAYYSAHAGVASAQETEASASRSVGASGDQPSGDAASLVFERDAFPLQHSKTAASTPGRYISDMATESYLEAYEDVLQDMFEGMTLEALAQSPVDPLAGPREAGHVAEPAPADAPPSTPEPASLALGQNNWEHLSPNEMRILSSSPKQSPPDRHTRHGSLIGVPPDFTLGHRVNSSPSGTRPTLHWDMEDLVEDALSTEQEDASVRPQDATLSPSKHHDPTLGGIPDVPLPSPRPGGIDEVEHIFGA